MSSLVATSEKTIPAPFFYCSGDVGVAFVLASPASRSSEVIIEFSLDCLLWKRATVKSSFTRFASSPSGRQHYVTWDSLTDVGPVYQRIFVRLRIDGVAADSYSIFFIDNLAPYSGTTT